MSRLFISHSSKGNFEAIPFRDWLEREGWAPEEMILDLHDIGPGARWKEALAKANERCEAVVLLASPASLGSPECRLEIRMAEDYGKEIIVAILYLLTMEDEALHRYREHQRAFNNSMGR
jgi:TIR domain